MSSSQNLESPTLSVVEPQSGTPRGIGVILGLSAYGIWGLLPLYFVVLAPAGPFEIVAARVLFSLIFCAILLLVLRSWKPVFAVFRTPKVILALTLAAVLIAINWTTYTYGVTSGQAIQASLGYFINPLISVLLGVVVLREKLRPLQWAAVGIGLVAVIELTVAYGRLPWIALVLALSFGFYGFIKKKVGGNVDAVTSLSVETAVLSPVALVVMITMGLGGMLSLWTNGPGHFWLLAASGVITAVPLLLFGASARHLNMTTIGLLQYVAPVLQFIVATVFLNEHMGLERWIGFIIVWFALILLTLDATLNARKSALNRRLAQAPTKAL